MNYVSTRNRNIALTASQAISQGLARDGGLLTPEVLPKLTPEMLEDLRGKSYSQRAVAVMKLFLEDFSEEELTAYTQAGYGAGKFDDPQVAPLHPLNDKRPAWSCGTAPRRPSRTWPCRSCPTSSPPPW